MPKYMIRCDMEGVTGVVSYAQAEPGGTEYDFGLRMFLADLGAAVEGLLSGGAEEVVIYDEHYYGRNVDLGMLPSRATVICGKPPYRPGWAGGLDDSFAGLVLLGFHSRRGTPGGLLNHTYEPDIRNLRLNGAIVGEIGGVLIEEGGRSPVGVDPGLVEWTNTSQIGSQVTGHGLHPLARQGRLYLQGGLGYGPVYRVRQAQVVG